MVLDTEPLCKEVTSMFIILGRLFLATKNTLINCQNRVMQLSFGNMTLELNVFNFSHQQIDHEEEESEAACRIETLIQRPTNQILQIMEPIVDSISSIE